MMRVAHPEPAILPKRCLLRPSTGRKELFIISISGLGLVSSKTPRETPILIFKLRERAH